MGAFLRARYPCAAILCSSLTPSPLDPTVGLPTALRWSWWGTWLLLGEVSFTPCCWDLSLTKKATVPKILEWNYLQVYLAHKRMPPRP